VRVILKPPANESADSKAILDRLVAMGCDYEGMDHSYVAVNIPATANFDDVCDFLTETGHTWEHADPTYEQLHSEATDGN
jgi:hypothetical protein